MAKHAQKIYAVRDITGTCPNCRHVRADKRRVKFADGAIKVHRWCDRCNILYGKALDRRKVKDAEELPLVEPWATDAAQERLF